MRTHKIVHSILLPMIIVLLLLGCSIRNDSRVSAPIITIKYLSKSNRYIVMLDGRKVETFYASGFKITIRPNSKPTLTYIVDKYDKPLFSADYEFIFSDYEQAKEYLHMEPGENAQVYATAEATASGCFISTSIETKRDDTFWIWIAIVCIIAGAAIYGNWIRTPKSTTLLPGMYICSHCGQETLNGPCGHCKNGGLL